MKIQRRYQKAMKIIIFVELLLFIGSHFNALVNISRPLTYYSNCVEDRGFQTNQNLYLNMTVSYQIEKISNYTTKFLYLLLPLFGSTFCRPYQFCDLVDWQGEPCTTERDNFCENWCSYQNFSFTLPINGTFKYQASYTLRLSNIKWVIDTNKIGEYNSSDTSLLQYLQPDPFVESNDSQIIALRNQIGSNSDPYTYAREVQNWILEHVSKKNELQEHSALWTLNNQEGDCSEFSNLEIALLRANGIPARKMLGLLLINASNRNYIELAPQAEWEYEYDEWSTADSGFGFYQKNNFPFHSWVEFFLPNYGWISCDPINNLFAQMNGYYFTYCHGQEQDAGTFLPSCMAEMIPGYGSANFSVHFCITRVENIQPDLVLEIITIIVLSGVVVILTVYYRKYKKENKNLRNNQEYKQQTRFNNSTKPQGWKQKIDALKKS